MKRTSLLMLSVTTVYRSCSMLVLETIKNFHTPLASYSYFIFL